MGTSIIFILVLMCFAGFHTWAKCLAMALFFGALLYSSLGKKSKLPRLSYIALSILILAVISSVWAIDASRNLEGIIYIVAIVTWSMLCSTLDDNRKEAILGLIPASGVIMTLLSVASFALPGLSQSFWQAERLGGIFQYSNTCALYLLIGVVIETEIIASAVSSKRSNATKTSGRKKADSYQNSMVLVRQYATLAMLIVGILLTGSRSILIIGVAWALYTAFTRRTLRKSIAISLAVTAMLAAIATLLTGSLQNIGRIFSIASSNSTLWGRLLYMLDGVKLIAKHPLGMGYMGYYFVQGEVQTGVYQTMFVHNDLLQLALDYGIISALLFVAAILLCILKGQRPRMHKELVVIISIASLADFHLQYLIIVMILILVSGCEDISIKGKATAFDISKLFKNYDTARGINTAMCAVSTLVSGYLFIIYVSLNGGNVTPMLKLMPNNTQALEMELADVTEVSTAIELSERILSKNEYSIVALNSLVYAYAYEGDYEGMIAYMDRAISLRPYDIDRYVAYDELLANEVANCNDKEGLYSIEEARVGLVHKLKSKEATTSAIAYRLRDKPVFEF